MVKNKVYLTVFLALLAGFVVLTGCSGAARSDEGEGRDIYEYGTFDGLSAETQRRIIQDCVDRDIGVWGIGHYYGTYNGWIVVGVKVPSTGVIEFDIIGGFKFFGVSSIIAWKNGQIHGLKDAYDLGLLTQEDLRSIAEYFPYLND